MKHKLSLTVLPATYAVCRLPPDTPIPAWVRIHVDGSAPFISVTRTVDELSIVCPEADVLDDPHLRVERGWRCLKVAGPLDFALTGVLAGLTGLLAPVGISVFAVSTYDTDYLMVRQASLERAIRALRLEGHSVGEAG